MRRWVRRMAPSANRISRCLPTASTAAISVPGAGRRTPPTARGASSRTSGWPASAGRSRSATRWMVSPSGTPAVCRESRPDDPCSELHVEVDADTGTHLLAHLVVAWLVAAHDETYALGAKLVQDRATRDLGELLDREHRRHRRVELTADERLHEAHRGGVVAAVVADLEERRPGQEIRRHVE